MKKNNFVYSSFDGSFQGRRLVKGATILLMVIFQFSCFNTLQAQEEGPVIAPVINLEKLRSLPDNAIPRQSPVKTKPESKKSKTLLYLSHYIFEYTVCPNTINFGLFLHYYKNKEIFNCT